jgi:hypothetical protein
MVFSRRLMLEGAAAAGVVTAFGGAGANAAPRTVVSSVTVRSAESWRHRTAYLEAGRLMDR